MPGRAASTARRCVTTSSEVLRCHAAAFEALGGAPREILYDRMKTAVLGEPNHEGIVYNRALIDLARHYRLSIGVQKGL